MNRNRQVTFSDYASCVAGQVAFLVEQGCADAGAAVPTRDLRECYDNGVSVDACAGLAR